MVFDMFYMVEVDGYKYVFLVCLNWYCQVDFYYYIGDVVYFVFVDMVIDDIVDFDLINCVMSDSMFIWFMFMYSVLLVFVNMWKFYFVYLLFDNFEFLYVVVNVDE